MSTDHHRFTLETYFGEADRRSGQAVSSALLGYFERCGIETAILLHGIEGFGQSRRLRTDRLETSSYDLPLVAVAVGPSSDTQQLASELPTQFPGALVTMQHNDAASLRPTATIDARLTIYCGGSAKVNGDSAAVAIVEHLQQQEVAGATVLFGIDGLVNGTRHTNHLFSRSERAPLAIVAVGNRAAIARALPGVHEMADRPVFTLDPVRVLKRDGEQTAALDQLDELDAADQRAEQWQKLTVYTSQKSRVYIDLIRRLLQAKASGATVFRGVWGYRGAHEPHGERLFALRPDLPIVVVVVARAAEIERLWPVIDRATTTAGLVTSEPVQAFRRESIRKKGARPRLRALISAHRT